MNSRSITVERMKLKQSRQVATSTYVLFGIPVLGSVVQFGIWILRLVRIDNNSFIGGICLLAVIILCLLTALIASFKLWRAQPRSWTLLALGFNLFVAFQGNAILLAGVALLLQEIGVLQFVLG